MTAVSDLLVGAALALGGDRPLACEERRKLAAQRVQPLAARAGRQHALGDLAPIVGKPDERQRPQRDVVVDAGRDLADGRLLARLVGDEAAQALGLRRVRAAGGAEGLQQPLAAARDVAADAVLQVDERGLQRRSGADRLLGTQRQATRGLLLTHRHDEHGEHRAQEGSEDTADEQRP